MDYKKIIKSQESRLKILKILEFLPDKLMIQIQYWIKTGRKLNLKNPVRFTEKLQWYKLNYRNSLMTKCADKYEVREYVASKGYSDILVPLYGVYKNANDIDFTQLPDKFVLKTTNGSHTNIFCENKSKLNIEDTKKTLNDWLQKRTVKDGREWCYYKIMPRIICEKLLDKDENNDLIDYKFYCFSGKTSYIKVITNRFIKNGHIVGIYNDRFEQLPFYRKGRQRLNAKIEKPKLFEEMINIAKALSEDFPHVRVDLYNINGQIYFGELTFYDASGYGNFDPDEFDFILGKQFILSKSD